MARTDASNVKEWHDTLMQMIAPYVLQRTADGEAIEATDFIGLFGELLESLLSAVKS